MLQSLSHPFKQELNLIDDKLKQIIEQNFLKNKISEKLLVSGKKIRALLMLWVASKTESINENHIELAVATELIHTATLIHDDIVDDSAERRGEKALHTTLGNKLAVLSGDYLLSTALLKLSSFNKTEILNNYSKAMQAMCIGEFNQQDSLNVLPKIKDYIEKNKQKTGELFGYSLKSACEISKSNYDSKDFYNFGLDFGIGFQILDDLKNFKTKDSKTTLNDLKDGIYTAPVIYACENNPELLKLIKDKKFTEVQNEILKSNAKSKTQELAKEYFNKGISKLPYNMQNDEFLSNIISYLLNL